MSAGQYPHRQRSERERQALLLATPPTTYPPHGRRCSYPAHYPTGRPYIAPNLITGHGIGLVGLVDLAITATVFGVLIDRHDQYI